MGAERVDYYSEDEYQQALAMEEADYHRMMDEEAEKAQQEAYEAFLMEEACRLEEEIKTIKDKEAELEEHF